MRIGILTAAVVAGACVANSAGAACTVATNEVVIVNNGMFVEAGVPIPIQLKAQWRVDGSVSGYLDVPHAGSIARPYGGDYPLMVDLQYSDKLRSSWRNGGSIDIPAEVNRQLQQICGNHSGAVTALTHVTIGTATADRLEYGVVAQFAPAPKP